MKKVLSVVLALVMCASFASFAMAADSVSYEGTVEEDGLRAVATDDNGGVYYAVVFENGVAIDYHTEDEIEITPSFLVGKADHMTAEEKAQYEALYKALADGSAVIPYDQIPGIVASEMVILDLFGVHVDGVVDLHHPGRSIAMKLNVGLKPGSVVAVMEYINGAWVPAIDAVVDVDGSILCHFEAVGPIVVAVKA